MESILVACKLINEWLLGMLLGVPWVCSDELSLEPVYCTNGALAFQPRGPGLGVLHGGDPAVPQ